MNESTNCFTDTTDERERFGVDLKDLIAPRFSNCLRIKSTEGLGQVNFPSTKSLSLERDILGRSDIDVVKYLVLIKK